LRRAVILAGGVGKRLRPLTEHRPKPLIPVAGRPCIDYVMRSLVKGGFDQHIITTGYLSDTLIKRIGDGGSYGSSILYSFEAEPAGTAGAVKKVSHFLDSTFVVASGDVLADIDIGALYDYHKKKKAMATMALTMVDDPTDFGIVGLDGQSRITRFLEKPKKEEVFSNLINAGIYVLEPEVLDYIPANQMFDFSKQVFPALLKDGKALFGKAIEGVWRDIGKPHDLLQASMDIVEREGTKMALDKVKTRGNIMMGQNCAIEKGVKIVGPAYIGDDVYISAGSVIENSCVYNNVFIDRDVMIENSIILEGSKVGWRTQLADSVISRNCQIEEDVSLVGSIVGDNMIVKKHSKLDQANVAPPSSNGGN
jgi:NDP-sugar pyrophosphorylase family protein